jgi:uncharacterized phage protein (TIGR01671 family)
MKREIKFRRVFVKDTDESFSHFGIWGVDINRASFISPPQNNKCHYVADQQYTGLKDKNGKEVYEGDLLREPIKENWDKENFVVFEVFFHDNDSANQHIGFQFNRLHFQGAICGYEMSEKFLPEYVSRMEVIGNVSENPELLK